MVVIAGIWFIAGRFSIPDKESKIEHYITKEMRANPTKYNDDYSFGYNIGLIRCNQIVNKVFED